MGDLDEAITEYRTALGFRPESASLHNSLALALMRQGRLDDAISEFRLMISYSPNNAAWRGEATPKSPAEATSVLATF